MCAWIDECLLDGCGEKCVANTVGNAVLTPVYVLAARKMAAALVCTATAGVVYDNYILAHVDVRKSRRLNQEVRGIIWDKIIIDTYTYGIAAALSNSDCAAVLQLREFH
jgi:hypothetical protein